jgi:ammonium transporter, Amt family
VVIGLVAGAICYLSATSLKAGLGYDDSSDAFGVHCVSGIVGALLTAVFASKDIGGANGSVVTQLISVGVTVVYGFVVSYVLLRIIDMTIGLGVTKQDEREGLDLALPGERVD